MGQDEIWPVTDGRRPANAAEWELHNDYVRQARRKAAADRADLARESQAAAADALRQQKEAHLKDAARAAYLRAGGNPAAFDSEWPGMLAAYRARLVADDLSGGRADVRINF